MMKIEIIIANLANRPNKQEALRDAMRGAFEEDDEVALFRKRAQAVEALYAMLDNIERNNGIKTSEAQRATIDQICKVLGMSYGNPKMDQVSHLISIAHVATVQAMCSMDPHPGDEGRMLELSELSKELRAMVHEESNEEMTPAERSAVLSLCVSVDAAAEEHEILEGLAAKKMIEILAGKYLIYGEMFLGIKSKAIRDKIAALYKKAKELDSVVNTLLSLSQKAGSAFDWITSS